MFDIRAEAPGDGAAIESLLDESFGVRRQTKISYRYRVGRPPVEGLSSVAMLGRALVGSIRYWTLRLEGDPALLLGPLAIEPGLQGRGIGRALVGQTLARAALLGHRLVFLVGDPAYYARFGFAPAPAAIVMPGENPARLQWLGLAGARPPEAGGLLLRNGKGRVVGEERLPTSGLAPPSGPEHSTCLLSEGPGNRSGAPGRVDPFHEAAAQPFPPTRSPRPADCGPAGPGLHSRLSGRSSAW